MFASLATVSTVFLAAVSLVAAHPMVHSELARRHTIETRGKPAGWPDKLLEDYDQYHTRYTALNCVSKHGDKAFFNSCCTPMLAGQKLSSRPAQCTPKASTNDDDDDDCDDDDTPPVKAAPPAKPTSSKVTVKSTSTKKSSPTPVKASGGNDNLSNTGGQATFFFQNGAAGACGQKHADSVPLVALDFRRYGNTNRASPDCGRHVLIKNTANGKTVTALVADACPSCENSNSLDLSTGAFDALGSRDAGVLPIIWGFID
jgi:hypothetical protein